ncbi:MAG: hypothetical protein HN348_18855 [Proteobacteria bacterium]|nr:hypothetical protein [Pseudomonadota bacterium]
METDQSHESVVADGGSVINIAWSPDSKWFVVGDERGMARIVEPYGAVLLSLPRIADEATNVATTRDGERQVRYEWAPSWNTQPTGVTVSLRLSNQGKKATPEEIVPLFVGGAFNSTYNDRDPIEVDIPADVVKVELVAITTGHGGATNNCAEFCVHSHHYTVGKTTYDQAFPEPGDDRGCSNTVNTGTVPNQAGTWWYGRGGWCPGRRVDPFVVDVTTDITPGQTATITYEAKNNGGAPFDDGGTIEHRSWIVISR